MLEHEFVCDCIVSNDLGVSGCFFIRSSSRSVGINSTRNHMSLSVVYFLSLKFSLVQAERKEIGILQEDWNLD